MIIIAFLVREETAKLYKKEFGINGKHERVATAVRV